MATKIKTVRILLCGEAGVGKTSIINMLTGQSGKISNGAVGATCKSEDYTYVKGDREYIFTDTIGLNESKGDTTTDAREAFLNLTNLLKKTELGFNLVIFVIKADRILETAKNNYELIVEKLLNHKVKVLCVVTHADSNKVIKSWRNENVKVFENKNMKFNDQIVIYSGDPTQYDDDAFINSMTKLKECSAKALWDKLLESNLVPEDPVNVFEDVKSLLVVLKQIWNFICDVLKIQDHKLQIHNKINTFKDLLNKMGLNTTEFKNIFLKSRLNFNFDSLKNFE